MAFFKNSHTLLLAFTIILVTISLLSSSSAEEINNVSIQEIGVQIGVPKSIAGTMTSTATGLSWKSNDGSIDLATLRFPSSRSLHEIYQKIRSRRGRRIIRDELSDVRFLLEGSDADGAQFIVHVEQGAADKHGYSITYRAQGRPDIAELAHQVASSYRTNTSENSASLVAAASNEVPITNVGGATPKSVAELSRFQRQAIQAQLTEMGHKGAERDGEFLLGTRAAIKSYQRASGSPVTGILTAQEINGLMQGSTYIREIIQLEGRDRFTAVDYNPLGKEKCEMVRTDLNTMANGTKVQFERVSGQAGSEFQLSWSFTPQQRRHPMYLMITFDQPVRFSGEGFYVLMPNARAPFGHTHASDKTRVVIPLYVNGGKTARSIVVIPILAGNLGSDATIVTPTGCGDLVAPVMAPTNITVAPGKPTIEIAEEAPSSVAQQTILSPNGDRLIEVTGDNTFRLVGSATGQTIISLPGKQPRFSPTGRFITAITEGRVVLRDAVDGAQMNSFNTTFSWDNKDSFILDSWDGVGGIDVRFPAVFGNSGGEFTLGCRVCKGIDTSVVKIDLENNLVLGANRSELSTQAAYSLTEAQDSSDRIAPNDAMPKYGSALQFAELTSRVVPLALPTDWEFIEKPQFPYLLADPTDTDPNSPWRRFYGRDMEPILQQTAAGPSAVKTQKARAATGSLSRNVSAVASNFNAARRSFSTRLADFGIFQHPTTPFEYVADGLRPTNIRKNDGRSSYVLHAYKLDHRIQIDTQDFSCGDYKGIKPDKAGVLTIALQRASFFATKAGNRTLTLLGGGCLAGSMGYSDPIIGIIDSRQPSILRPIISGVPFSEDRNPGGGCEGSACDFHVTLSHERYLLIWSSYAASMEVVDLDHGKTVAFVPYRGDAIEQLTLTPDARMLIQRNKDGTFAVHDVQLGVPVNIDSYSNAGRMNMGGAKTAMLYGRYADDGVP